jgi:hypothetical protein
LNSPLPWLVRTEILGGRPEFAIRPTTAPNHIWSYDFMSGRTRAGASLRILNVVDEHTRVALGCRVDRSIGAGDVVAELQRLFDRCGKPRVLRSDNGRECIAASLVDWLAERGVATAFIEKGSPQQNPFVERFNGTTRDELLNGEEFDSLTEARVVIGAWVEEYNTLRPHRGLGMMTPSRSPPVAEGDASESDLPHTTWTARPATPTRLGSSLTARRRTGTLNQTRPNSGAGQSHEAHHREWRCFRTPRAIVATMQRSLRDRRHEHQRRRGHPHRSCNKHNGGRLSRPPVLLCSSIAS